MKILAIKWRQLGDTVLWTPALAALRQLYPRDQIDLSFPEAYSDLLSQTPDFQNRWTVCGQNFPWALLRKVRREKYDLVLNFHASATSARFSVLCAAKERVIHHHSREGKRGFLSRPVVGAGLPIAAQERDLNVIRTLGWKGESPPTAVTPSSEWLDTGKKLLTQSNVSLEKKLVVFSPYASRLSKQWPLARYREITQTLGSDVDAVVLFDSIEKRDAYREGKLAAHCVVTPRLQDLIGVLSHADLVVGSDSGVKHLAIALGRKTVTLFGPESLGEWHGYPQDKHPAIQRKVLCRDRDPQPEHFSWCGVSICPLASHACLNLISVEEVNKTIHSLLANV